MQRVALEGLCVAGAFGRVQSPVCAVRRGVPAVAETNGEKKKQLKWESAAAPVCSLAAKTVRKDRKDPNLTNLNVAVSL